MVLKPVMILSLYLSILVNCSSSEGNIPFEIEEMDELDRLNEYILTSLRTSWGLDISFVSQTFEKDLIQEKRSEISKFQEQGWLVWKDNTLSLSKSGMLLADSIAAALFF